MYCSASDVYRTAGITSSEVSEADVTQFILEAEEEVDRITNTTYWAEEDSGTASGGSSTTLVDSSKSWTDDDYIGDYCWVYGGTGSGQVREITDNNSTAITVSPAWATNPSSDSDYRIIHTGKNPYVDGSSDGLYDGDDTDTFFLPKYPLRLLVSVSIDGTSVSTSNIYQYKDSGKLLLGSDAEVSSWTSKTAQKNVIEYWWGVYPLPYEVKRLAMVVAAIKTLSAQMGGTHNIPSTYSLPEGSVTIGQAYINIKGTWDTLIREYTELVKRVIKYASFA